MNDEPVARSSDEPADEATAPADEPAEAPAEEAAPDEAAAPIDAAADDGPIDATAEAAEAGTAAPDDAIVIDLVPDEVALARAQLEAGLHGTAEGTAQRRLAWLEAGGEGSSDEADALRLVLAEALWRQGRPVAARQALAAIRVSSPERRSALAAVIEADVLAAAGERDRAQGTMERVVDAAGAETVFELRGDMPGQLAWPLPPELQPQPASPARAPWGSADAGEAVAQPPADDARVAAARARLEESRVAYVAGDIERGDVQMSIALRLEPGLAAEGVAILEPTLGGQPAPERLLLYGDLLRAAGRHAEAREAYDRAAGRRG